MITRPLELESRLSPPPRDLDFVAWLNVALIVLFFGLLGSRFVLAPGFLIGGESAGVELPRMGKVQYSPTATLVVTYRQDGVILFEGAIVKFSELKVLLEAYARRRPGEVLLLRADRRVTLQALSELSAMAQSVGFAYVQMAGEPTDSSDEAQK